MMPSNHVSMSMNMHETRMYQMRNIIISPADIIVGYEGDDLHGDPIPFAFQLLYDSSHQGKATVQ